MKDHPINPEYGQVFRNLRTSKNFHLEETAFGIISSSQLSRFERGNSRISVDAFLRMLERINVELGEFQQIYNEGSSQNDSFLSYYEVYNAYMHQDLQKLDDLLEKANQNIEQHPDFLKAQLDKLMVKAVRQQAFPDVKLSNHDLNFIFNYLREVGSWGIYEIRLLQWTAGSFDPYNLSSLANIMVSPARIEIKTYQSEVNFNQALLNIINQFLKTNELNLATKYIKFMEEHGIRETQMNERLTLICHKTRLAFKRGDKQALEAHQRNLEAFKYCGCSQIAKMVNQEIKEMEQEIHIQNDRRKKINQRV